MEFADTPLIGITSCRIIEVILSAEGVDENVSSESLVKIQKEMDITSDTMEDFNTKPVYPGMTDWKVTG